MLSFEDCLGLCGLSEREVLAIAQHEHIPAMAAAELGNYLANSAEGEQCIKAMILDDIAQAEAAADAHRALALKLVLRNFILQHPRCEDSHRRELQLPGRRAGGQG